MNDGSAINANTGIPIIRMPRGRKPKGRIGIGIQATENRNKGKVLQVNLGNESVKSSVALEVLSLSLVDGLFKALRLNREVAGSAASLSLRTDNDIIGTMLSIK